MGTYSPRRSWALFGLAFLLCLLAGSLRAEPAVWVVQGKNATVYLIGTVHLLHHDTKWMTPKIAKAIDRANELWLEVANAADQSAAVEVVKKYGMDSKHSLSTKLDAETQKQLKEVAGRYGMPAALFEPMQPWTAGLTLVSLPLLQAGFDPNAGVDLFLEKRAKARGEPVHGFETMEEQARFFADMSQKEQVDLLKEAIKDAKKGIGEFQQLAEAWLSGDLRAIDVSLNEEMKKEAPKLYKTLLVQRNQHWLGPIEKLLNGSGVKVVATGVAHMVGPDGLPAQLQKRGYKVQPY